MTTLTFKIPDAEAREIREEARRRRLTLSEYLRRRIVSKPAASPQKRIIGKNRFSGMPCDATPGAVVATQQQIDEALSQFP